MSPDGAPRHRTETVDIGPSPLVVRPHANSFVGGPRDCEPSRRRPLTSRDRLVDQELVALLEPEAGDLVAEHGLAVDDAENVGTKLSRVEQEVLFELRVLIEGGSQRFGDRVPAHRDPVRADEHLEDRRKAQLDRRGTGRHGITAAVTE